MGKFRQIAERMVGKTTSVLREYNDSHSVNIVEYRRHFNNIPRNDVVIGNDQNDGFPITIDTNALNGSLLTIGGNLYSQRVFLQSIVSDIRNSLASCAGVLITPHPEEYDRRDNYGYTIPIATNRVTIIPSYHKDAEDATASICNWGKSPEHDGTLFLMIDDLKRYTSIGFDYIEEFSRYCITNGEYNRLQVIATMQSDDSRNSYLNALAGCFRNINYFRSGHELASNLVDGNVDKGLIEVLAHDEFLYYDGFIWTIGDVLQP